MDTILTSEFPVSEKVFEELCVDKFISEYISGLDKLFKVVSSIRKNRYIAFTENICFDFGTGIFFPDFNVYKAYKISDFKIFNEKDFLSKNTLLRGCESELPKLEWLKSASNILKKFFDINTWIVYEDSNRKHYLYNIHTDMRGVISIRKSDNVVAFPTVKVGMFNSNGMMFLNDVYCKYKIYPTALGEVSKSQLGEYIELRKYFSVKDGKITCNPELRKALVEGRDEEILAGLHGKLIDILKQCKEKRKIGGVTVQAKEKLLNCEKVRADIEPYEERILTDPNRGHWDLWTDNETDSYTVKMENEYMARNPKCDINEEGVIAIDFGTKSTVVVYQSDIEHSLPMAIGDGNLSKAPTPKRYENPTVMQFVNLEKFLEAYNSKAGRPDTVWEDLPISHTAMDKFRNSKSTEYYAFLHQIKQWAGQRKKQFRIQPIKGESLLLPAFMDLKEDDMNPIEIYAYYIGLYINNMRKGHGIFLDYYLSFPVTYETKIRQKIVESFTKGLKKSLPVSIQQDQDIMSNFKVNGDISEPAAYAVCALQEYGFEPAEDEEVFYGIFDFGGGTTDFDFGLWKCSQKRRYDYRIENFGAGGDEFLGGENLLEMLAFEIFKENQEVMRKGNYTFTLAPKSTEFLGSDALLSDSQEAEKNMHNLMEELRPYWEKTDRFEREESGQDVYKLMEHVLAISKTSAYYYEIVKEIGEIRKKCKDNQDGLKEAIDSLIKRYSIKQEENDESEEVVLKVSLFDKEGRDYPNVELFTTRKFIDDFIEGKIREGVKNFFAALLLSYQNEKVKKPTTLNIFLAGNSCKSPVVKKVFEEEIEEQEKNIKEKFGLNHAESFFEIFPPLGTKEAYKKMKERGIPFRENDFEKPTGKTGVAFGLIQCRAGGTIERVSNVDSTSEIPFQYFLGWQSRKKFVLFKDDSKLTTLKGKPNYNEWYKFIEADADTFYLYYTTLPECVNGNLLVDGNAAVKRIKCNVEHVDDNAFVYIRATSPHTIQYAVSTDYDVDKNVIGEIYTKELG